MSGNQVIVILKPVLYSIFDSLESSGKLPGIHVEPYKLGTTMDELLEARSEKLRCIAVAFDSRSRPWI